ncbi:MAG: carboxypeptidase regulatory-like domain-containing protein [Saprospiraceae bacterium]|nr:carboxypeptidase regulatory-like domain-containing protein [Saprospiraceae bacterium]
MKKKNKQNSFQLQVPDPCSESWDAMMPLPGGRYCSRCEKTVVDFSAMPEQQMLGYMLQREGRVCGRFRSDQLNRPLTLYTPPGRWQQLRAAGLLLSGLTLATGLAAQQLVSEPPQMMTIERELVDRPDSEQKKRVLSGIVTDAKGEAIIDATIFLKWEDGRPSSYGTVSDFDGRFQLHIPEIKSPYRIAISYLGYETREFLPDEIQSPLNVSLQVKSFDLTEVVVTEYGVQRRMGIMGGATSIREERPKPSIPAPKEALIGEVYPNPFISELNVKLEMETDAVLLFHLYNAAGQLVFAQAYDLPSGHHTTTLNLGGRRLPAGAYFLRISDDKGELRTKQVVKVE